MSNKSARKFINDNIVECKVSHRGGYLKVDASQLFPEIEGKAIIGCYQNYLGGGIAGAIIGSAMFNPNDLDTKNLELFSQLVEECKLMFFEINNGGGDDYMQENMSMELNQALPESGY